LLYRGWRSEAVSPHVELFLSDAGPPPTMLRSDRRAIAIGDVYSNAEGVSAQACIDLTSDLPASAAAAHLADQAWGRYVLIFLDALGRLEAAARDPSGALGCVSWETAGGRVVTAAAGELATILPPSHAGIDWDALIAQLADPTAFAKGSALLGVSSLAPGGLRDFRVGTDHQLWTPARWVAQPISNGVLAKQKLAEAIDGAVAALACGRPVAAEVSGGLDSGIVAAALSLAGADVRGWLHLASDGADADERHYGEAMVAQLDGSLEVSHLEDAPIDLDYVLSNQTDVLPSISSFEAAADHAFVSLCRARGARALFTGMGGDGVLWAAPYPVILADRIAREGLFSAFSPQSVAIARWTRRPVLLAFWRALAPHQREAAPIFEAPEWLTRSGGPVAHPWLADIEDLPPGKQIQIRFAIAMQASLGVTARRKALDVIDPLLSQPVLEICLRLPLDVLVCGGRDRGLARTAFARRLPRLVLERRSKGDTTRRSAISLAASLESIRALLLDGRLVQETIVDRSRLEVALREDTLARGAELLSIYRAIAIELWVRAWESRLATAPADP
jgi:asparagine synthase (glutamine-hydrolysing)